VKYRGKGSWHTEANGRSDLYAARRRPIPAKRTGWAGNFHRLASSSMSA